MAASPTFSDRALQAAAARGGRLCVGIDPHASVLHSWGLDNTVAGLERFCGTCVEAFAHTVALVKPQVAFFERFGSRGFAVLERTIADLRQAGALVVADAKRGDIGSTMAGYAEAWLGEDSPLSSDAVTVSPFLGYHSLDPLLHKAEQLQRGVFVLAGTSNPEGRQVQDARAASGRTLTEEIIAEVAASNRKHRAAGAAGGNVGVVVGATLLDPPPLDAVAGPVLMPGVGAQGAGPKDVARIAGTNAELVFPNMSRGILAAGPGVAQLRDAVARAAENYPAGGLPRR